MEEVKRHLYFTYRSIVILNYKVLAMKISSFLGNVILVRYIDSSIVAAIHDDH